MQKGKARLIGSFPNQEFAPALFISACLLWFLSVTVSFWRPRRDLCCCQNCSAEIPQFILATWHVCSSPGCWWLDRHYFFMSGRHIFWGMFIYKLEEAVTTGVGSSKDPAFKKSSRGVASRNNILTMSTGKSAGWFCQNVLGFWAMSIH